MSRAMTVIARTVAATPVRSATETWAVIVDLIAPDATSPARRDLDAVAGVACALITEQALAGDALVVHGGGPRVRVYAKYGDDALTGDGVREDPLSTVPTNGDWRLSLPCPEDDLAWVQRSLTAASARVRARSLGASVPGEEDGDSRASAGGPAAGVPTVNLDAFLRR